jgi:hypothetical protein
MITHYNLNEMKQLRVRALLTILVTISFTCFIYLNTRQELTEFSYKSEYQTLGNNNSPDIEKEDKSSYHVLKSGIVLLAKALVLSDK